MSNFNLAKANKALDKTARTACYGSAQQRNGRFITPLEMINERLVIETRSALKSWAFVEKSHIFNKRRQRFCLTEQTFRSDITPVLYMNLINAWREALLIFFRLTDKAETGGQTFPAFLKEYRRLDLDYPAYAKEKHKVSFLALGLEEEWKEHITKCQTMAKDLKTNSYINHKKTEEERQKRQEAEQKTKLGKLYIQLKVDLRIPLMAHSKAAGPLLLTDYKKEARQAMIFIASFSEATEFITYGRKAGMYSYFKAQCKSAEQYWAMCDKHISDI